MNIKIISELLKSRIGLNPSTVGLEVIRRAVHRCMDSSGYEKIERYIEDIRSNDKEFRKLIDEVVIPETSFFRDKAPFIALKEFISYAISDNDASHEIKILSIPCSTGEESYSIAMTFLEMGVDESRFSIHAYDVSDKLIDYAKKGIYSQYY